MNNVVIRSLPEIPDVSDSDLVSRMFCDLKLDEVIPHIEKVHRQGRKRNYANNDGDAVPFNRPIRVICGNSEHKKIILNRATEIRFINKVNNIYNPKKVFIVPDLTQLQREEDIKLRKDLNLKRQEDPNWIIKRGRIVRKLPAPQEAQD